MHEFCNPNSNPTQAPGPLWFYISNQSISSELMLNSTSPCQALIQTIQ